MQENYFKNRLMKIQERFNETFGMNPLIHPKFRRTIIFAIIKLGILERKISEDFNATDRRQFKMMAKALKKIFAAFDIHDDQKQNRKS